MISGLILATAALSATLAHAETVSKAEVPGVVIHHIPAPTERYIGSPSITRLANGHYIASHDVFGPGKDPWEAVPGGGKLSGTIVFGSSDRGQTWQRLSQIDRQAASTLFVHNGVLYILGLGHGSVAIRRSTDGGRTWTTPRDDRTGLLLARSRYHTAPVPVIVHDGRLWRTMEDTLGPGGWGSHFRAFMMSAPVDADLLQSANWTCSERLGKNATWLNGEFDGWLEGNAVVTPNGDVANILRVHYHSYDGAKAAIIRVSKDGKSASFDPDTGLIDFPGGAKKFTLRFDPVSKQYWSLASYMPECHKKGGRLYQGGNAESTRNTMALISSPDLHHWTVRSIILYHPDATKHGFQYADWLFEGEDIIAVSRTAYDDDLGGAHDMHDANYLTFHRIKSFRQARNLQLRSSEYRGGVPAHGVPLEGDRSMFSACALIVKRMQFGRKTDQSPDGP